MTDFIKLPEIQQKFCETPIIKEVIHKSQVLKPGKYYLALPPPKKKILLREWRNIFQSVKRLNYFWTILSDILKEKLWQNVLLSMF